MWFIISFLILLVESGIDPCTTIETPLTNIIKTISQTESDEVGGSSPYSYEVWTNSPGGDNKISLYDQGAAFSAEWDNPDDFLGRVGLRWKRPVRKLYPELGNIVADYAYKRSGRGTGGEHYNYIGIYGWAYPDRAKGIPLVEYYIIDDWFGNNDLSDNVPVNENTLCPDSSATKAACLKGSFTVDGEEYKIYTNIRENKPSILGDTTFTQYFNIRQTTRKCGRITISEHFKKWNSMNLQMGKLFEASFLVEVEKGAGFLNYTYATVQVGVPDSDITPGNYAPACVDRTPNAGNCVDPNDGSDAPPCYLQPGGGKCGLSCPLDFEPDGTKKCVLRASYTDAECSARIVQTTDCKDAAGGDASCEQFGCGPLCYLNFAKRKCSLACGSGETAVAGSNYCERGPCAVRTPRPDDAGNFDVTITLKRVEFDFGWKSGCAVKVKVGEETKTSAAVVGDNTNITFNEVFKWNNIAPASLNSVDVAVGPAEYNLNPNPKTINISGGRFKVGSVAEGSEATVSYIDDTAGEYDNGFTVFFDVAITGNWLCGSSSENVKCYLNGNGCAEVCPKTSDDATGRCTGNEDAGARVVHWGSWALCLLIMCLFL